MNVFYTKALQVYSRITWISVYINRQKEQVGCKEKLLGGANSWGEGMAALRHMWDLGGASLGQLRLRLQSDSTESQKKRAKPKSTWQSEDQIYNEQGNPMDRCHFHVA